MVSSQFICVAACGNRPVKPGLGSPAALLVFGFFLAYFFPVLKTKLNYIFGDLISLFSTRCDSGSTPSSRQKKLQGA